MKAKDIMTKRVIVFKPEDSLFDIIKGFSKHNISGAPVVNSERKVVGVVSDTDVIRAMDIYNPKINLASMPDLLLILAGLKARKHIDKIEKELSATVKIRVDNIMTKNPVIVNEDASLEEIIRLMNHHSINRILLVNKEHKLAGIATREDIIKALSKS